MCFVNCRILSRCLFLSFFLRSVGKTGATKKQQRQCAGLESETSVGYRGGGGWMWILGTKRSSNTLTPHPVCCQKQHGSH